MSILIPVASCGITLNEIPGKVSLYFEIGECTKHCPGCHSPHLCCPRCHKMTMMEMVEKAEEAKELGANAIVLMGGTTNGISWEDLFTCVNTLAAILPVGLYSGSDKYTEDMIFLMFSELTWLKSGSYKEKLGGLSSPKTNQTFWEKRQDSKGTYYPVDITEVFQC